MQYNVISGDSHVDMTWMPGDLWVSQAPAKFQAVAPHVVETDEGLKWTAEGKTLGVFGGSSFGFGKAERGASRRIDSMFAEGFYEGPPRPTTPELRLKDMEMDGVDAEVLYGILGVGMRFDDPELTRYVYNVYYDWAAEFCATNPGRWAALAPLASHDPQLAAEDLRRAAKLGLKGADFAVSIAVKPLYQQEWDVLWEAASECEMPVSFHFTVGMRPSIRQPDPEDLPAYKTKLNLVSDACSQLEGALHLTSIIYSGRVRAVPELQVGAGRERRDVGALPPGPHGRTPAGRAPPGRPAAAAERVLATAGPLDLPDGQHPGGHGGPGGRGQRDLGLGLPAP